MSDHGRGEHSGHDVGDTPPDSGEREKSCCDPATWDDFARLNELQAGTVLLPFPLAQRILAALGGVDGGMDMGCASLAAELRERMPR